MLLWHWFRSHRLQITPGDRVGVNNTVQVTCTETANSKKADSVGVNAAESMGASGVTAVTGP